MDEIGRIEVPRTARYHVRAARGRAREAWFLLHGYGQLAAAFLDELGSLARDDRVLVAPEALSRFYLRRGTGATGASWMTREEREHEIRDTLGYLDRLAARIRSEHSALERLSVLGFSQGGAAAARWALLGQTPLAEVVSFGCPLPGDLDLAARAERTQGLAWTFALGDEDASIDRAAWEDGLARLRASGVTPTVHRFAGGHRLDAPTLDAL